MKFSLILATIGRTQELSRFLASLDAQTYHDFELIVVDQNVDDRLVPILTPYQDKFSIVSLKSSPGLSRARNIGIKKATGDILAFPDDDCWYPPDLLAQVAAFFNRFPQYDGYTGRAVDEGGHVVAGRFDKQKGEVSLNNIWKRHISISIFLRETVIHSVGLFDETLGVGAGTIYGSGEETDYLIRAIKSGINLYYDPDLFVYHPNPVLHYNRAVIKRGFMYGCGMGRVLQKHCYPIGFVLYKWARPLGGIILSLLQGHPRKAIYHAFVFVGRIKGYLV